ncbi:MAG: large conductance mechanosensitive channel protein MscL, partial [Nevskiaceae bacterium]
DVVTPPLGLLIGGMDFSDLAITLRAATEAAPAVTLKDATATAPAVVLSYGKFIQAAFDFTIVAFAVFLLVKGVNHLKRKEAEAPSAPPTPSREEQLLAEIRDLLKAGRA